MPQSITYSKVRPRHIQCKYLTNNFPYKSVVGSSSSAACPQPTVTVPGCQGARERVSARVRGPRQNQSSVKSNNRSRFTISCRSSEYITELHQAPIVQHFSNNTFLTTAGLVSKRQGEMEKNERAGRHRPGRRDGAIATGGRHQGRGYVAGGLRRRIHDFLLLKGRFVAG